MDYTMPSLWVIFTTGLLTGGLTCMAVQGGLLATLIAGDKGVGEGDRQKATAIVSFLVAKLIAYSILGLLFGWLGSFFQLSFTAQAVLFTVAAAYMIGAALNILDVHPLFRYFAITPPRFVRRLVRNQSKSTRLFAPVTLGAATIFIPCGTTQAMMALAIASGKPILGMLILSTFVLGTSPIFFLLGYGITKLKDVFQTQFRRVAATAIILMALWNINNALVISGSTWSPSEALREVYCTITFCDSTGSLGLMDARATTTPTIYFEASGYTIDNPFIPAGATVSLKLVNSNGRGCIQAFTIPKLGIRKTVPLGSTETVTFTAPQEQGELAFSCSMGMYRGKFAVIGRGT